MSRSLRYVTYIENRNTGENAFAGIELTHVGQYNLLVTAIIADRKTTIDWSMCSQPRVYSLPDEER